MRILNRIITLTETGVLYEADPRHYELMIRKPGLNEAKGAVTPGVKPTDLDLEAIKEGAPEPWNDEAWRDDDEDMSASMRDLCEYEVEKTVMLKNMFAVKKVQKDPKLEPMDVDFEESCDVDMGVEDGDRLIDQSKAIELPPLRSTEHSSIDDWVIDRPKVWADATDVNHVVRFNETPETHIVPNVFNTYKATP